MPFELMFAGKRQTLPLWFLQQLRGLPALAISFLWTPGQVSLVQGKGSAGNDGPVQRLGLRSFLPPCRYECLIGSSLQQNVKFMYERVGYLLQQGSCNMSEW